MQILESNLKDGIIRGRLHIECDDILMAANQQKAIQQGILALAESFAMTDVHFASVTDMKVLDDDSVEICVEAAVPPKVTLGQYKNLRVSLGHNEDFQQAVLQAAADNITVDIPQLIVERKIDALVSQAQTEVLQSSSLHTLADIHAIIVRLNRQIKAKLSDEELWKQALSASESYIAQGAQDVDIMVSSIREFCKAPEDSIFRGIVTRAQERAKMEAETIASQVFDAYLHTQGISLTAWRDEKRQLAAQQCRQELMLDAVIKTEGISANEMEFSRRAYELASSYGMDVSEFLSYVGEDGIRKQICEEKAIKLIVDSAKHLA